MFTITKDGMTATVTNPSSLPMYLSKGWKVVTKETKKEEAVPELTKKQLQSELTKKQLQEKLDELGATYKPTDNKAALLKKVKSAAPDNFDDGLLKG